VVYFALGLEERNSSKAPQSYFHNPRIDSRLAVLSYYYPEDAMLNTQARHEAAGRPRISENLVDHREE